MLGSILRKLYQDYLHDNYVDCFLLKKKTTKINVLCMDIIHDNTLDNITFPYHKNNQIVFT